MPGELFTPRLRLRPLAPSDERSYCALYTDPDVMHHVAAPLAPDTAQRAFRSVLKQLAADPPRPRYWMLGLRDGNGDAGLVACIPDRQVADAAEVGVLLQVPFQFRGYAVEALAAIIDDAFREGGVHRLRARHARNNDPMASVMGKLGFECLERQGEVDDPDMVEWRHDAGTWRSRFGGVAGSAAAEISC